MPAEAGGSSGRRELRSPRPAPRPPRFICEAGDRGRTWREVQRKFRRVKARDLKEIYESLEREGSIRVETTPMGNGGWPVKTAFPV